MVDTTAIDLIVEPFAFEGRAILPRVPPLSLFLRFDVLAFELGAFRPLFRALPVLLIVFPLAFVAGSFHVFVDAHAICFIIHPASFISVIISMVKRTLPIRLIILPHPLIPSAIGPLHRPLPVSQSTQPLAFINRASLISIFPGNYRLFSLEFFTGEEGLHGLVFLEIPGLDLRRHRKDSVLSSVQPAAD